jgi:general stress protein YciG
MTLQSPRIYLYKITFEEVPYYYYGVHKEVKYNDYYMGSPVTHKWCWNFYTPKKQILQLFEFSDEGWLEAQRVETRLIRPAFNTDKWCLNENVGGILSINAAKRGGKLMGKIRGSLNKDKKLGIFGISLEEKIVIGKRNYELKLGIHARTPEKMSEDGKKATQKAKELNVGIYSQTIEQKSECGKKGGKSVSSQVWECTITGFRTNAGSLSRYQMKREIETSNRIRIR